MELIMYAKKEKEKSLNQNGNLNNTKKEDDNKENKKEKEAKSHSEQKKEDKYFKLINSCVLGFKDKLRIMKRAYENDTIKIFIEVLKNGEKELIHLKNVTFYSHDELIDSLTSKFNKIIKTHHLN